MAERQEYWDEELDTMSHDKLERPSADRLMGSLPINT